MRCQSEVQKKKVTRFFFLRVYKEHHQGECEVFQVSGPATWVRIAAAEAQGALMRRRQVAAGSSPSRLPGSQWWQELGMADCKPVPPEDTQSGQLPQQGSSSSQGPRLDRRLFALATEAKGNFCLDRCSL